MVETVHFALYDTLADWEIGYATAHLNKPDRHRTRDVVTATVGAGAGPVTTMGGLRVLPDIALADLRPADSAMLVLPGNDIWDGPAFAPWAEKAREFLAAGVPVAAICGATGGLALAGLLDDRDHTSNAAEFLAGTGYAGGPRYRDEAAVDDQGLITASGTAPVEFARAILARLEVYEPHVLAAWYRLFRHQDPAGFYELTAS